MGRIVLRRESRSIGGSVTMPNGFTDYGRLGIGETGPGWCATASASVQTDYGAAIFATNGPESHPAGPDQIVTATIQVLGTAVSLNFAGVFSPGYENYNPGHGRGITGDTISGSFSFTGLVELVLYTHGEEPFDGMIPDDYYPHYGGERVVGEFPTNHGVLVWETVPGATCSGTVTFGGRSATASGSSPHSFRVTDYVAFNAQTLQSQAGGRALGIVTTTISAFGEDVSTTGTSVTYDFPTDPGRTAAGATVGAGSATCYIDTASGYVPSGDIGGISAGGILWAPKRANVALDAMAMDKAYPGPVTWKIVEKYLGVVPPGPGEEYGTIVDPLVPIVTTRVGQSVGAAIHQRREGLGVGIYQMAVGQKHRTNGQPARGEVMGVYREYDHYVNEQGPVLAWCVPPAGEDPSDWRVGWRGRASGGIRVSRVASLPLELPEPSTDGAGLTVYDFDPPSVWEGYRYAEATIPEDAGTSLAVNGKSWSVSPGSTKTLDLCFPDAGPPEFSVDRQDTRWPLDDKRLSTVDSPTWGVSVARSLTSGGPVSSVTLKDGSAPIRLHFIAPFATWEQEVPDDVIESQGDTYTVEHYCARLAIGDVAGRQAFEVPHARKTVNNAPNRSYSTDYAHLSCSAVAALIEEIPGWNAEGVLDAWDNDPSAWECGQGYVRQGGAWAKQWDRGTGLVVAQPVYDSLEWSGDVDDAFGLGGGAVLQLIGRKVFRGSAYGATDRDGKVMYSDLGTGTTDEPPAFSATTEEKRYLVGPTLSTPNDWGRVWSKPDHKASVGGYPRRIERAALRIVAVVASGVHLIGDDRGFLLATLTRSDRIEIRRFDTLAADDSFTIAEGEYASAQTAFGPTGHLATYYDDPDGNLFVRRSTTSGEIWEAPLAIGQGLTDPAPTIEMPTGVEFVALHNGSEWRLWSQDRNGDLVDRAKIVEDDAGRAGLAFRGSTLRELVFYVGDRRFLSTNLGETWEEI